MKRRKRPSLRFCVPGYRWCGPGCSGPGKPLNAVDACCKEHDECLSIYGQTKCCDEQLKQCLKQKINPHTKLGRDAALFYAVIHLRNLFEDAF
ncbi:Parvovirus coat protein VP1-like protein [Neobacillus piezotolerans]|uniref:Parvovirus coat protein VP1-like protein n=2 Tax=Neobacillus piezotolerans TaxID=2259171 RepID=A0A3D8GMZ1_9BACI|nr:Parvovirus coat protein VP1-like protein [Neobacillus piezotolerans]RDU35865.1 Parvovirus coat protein VP1-like protein [Neobacillus piezotolerans]